MANKPSKESRRAVFSWMGKRGAAARFKAIGPKRRKEIARLGGLAKHRKKSK